VGDIILQLFYPNNSKSDKWEVMVEIHPTVEFLKLTFFLLNIDFL
jgi:hypothetical protein